MKVLIDADACPVVDIAVNLCLQFHVKCVLFCDTAHEMHRNGAETVICDKGADSVDFTLVNQVESGDIIITQDYGLASMCLAKNASVLHQDGWAYSQFNIDALLFQRHASSQYRAAGGRTKGPSKRTTEQNKAFLQAFTALLQNRSQG